MTESVEYQTIQQCSEKLKVSFQLDPITIADKLLSRGFISSRVYGNMGSMVREAQARELIICVMTQVEVNHKRFHEFMEILKEELWLCDIHDILQATYSMKTINSTHNPNHEQEVSIISVFPDNINTEASAGPSADNFVVRIMSALDDMQTGQQGEMTVAGRRIRYKAKWRVHSFNEPLVWDSTAQDVTTGISVEVSREYTDKSANQIAVKKLCEELKSRGILS